MEALYYEVLELLVVLVVVVVVVVMNTNFIIIVTYEVLVDGFVVYALYLGSVEGVGDVESRAVKPAVLVFPEGGVVAIFRARPAAIPLRR